LEKGKIMKYIFMLIVASMVLAACGSNETAQIPETNEEVNANSQQAMTEPAEAGTEATDMEAPAEYTMDEIASHKTPEDCWFVIDGKVYDVSGFGEKHAGGEAVYLGCGKDATEMFNDRPNGSGSHSEEARSFLPNFEIGVLAE
jgi:cytochrome b involved in lipid metabolism